MANKSDEDDKFNAEWIIPLRNQAGFKTRDDFQRAVEKHLKRALDSRYFAGLERIDKSNEYRDQSKAPYDAIVQALNEKLLENEQVTVEQLKGKHQEDILRREDSERGEAAVNIALAIDACPQLLKEDLSKKCKTQDARKVADHVIKQIQTRDTLNVTELFTEEFDRALVSTPNQENKAAIWNLVQAIIPACIASDAYAGDGSQPSKNIEFAHAWVIRISLLLQAGLPITGVGTQQEGKDCYLDDEQTYAYISNGKAYGSAEERAKQLVEELVKKYDPARPKPPDPTENSSGFQQYCRRLNASLALDRKGAGLFFCLMLSESKEVIEVCRTYLPKLLSFVCQAPENAVEGFLLDDIDIFNQWIARWMVTTGQGTQIPPPRRKYQEPNQGSTNMQATDSQINQPQINSSTTYGNVINQINKHGANSVSVNESQMQEIKEELQNLIRVLGSEPEGKSLQGVSETLLEEIESKQQPSQGMAKAFELVGKGLTLGKQASELWFKVKQLLNPWLGE